MSSYMYTQHHNDQANPYDYVSLFQNHITISLQNSVSYPSLYTNIYPFSGIVINSGIISKLMDDLCRKRSISPLLIFDASKIKYAPIHSYEERFICLFNNGGYSAVLVLNDNKETSKLIKNEAEKYNDLSINFIGSDELNYLITKKECYIDIISKYNWISPDIDVSASIIHDGNRYIFEHTMSNECDTLIESSNVQTNRYFNAKDIFLDNRLFNRVTIMLLDKYMSAQKSFDDFDAYLCSSITGACIGNALSILTGKPIVFLKNIGPSSSNNDERTVQRIIAGKSYVYVFDFCCLGTEYNRARLLCMTHQARIIHSIGISYFKMPHNLKKESISALFWINEFEENYYKCFAK